MKVDLRLNPDEVKDILKDVIMLKYKLNVNSFSFNFDLIDDRSGTKGFTGVTAFCTTTGDINAISKAL